MNNIEIQPSLVRDALRGLHDVERLAQHPFAKLEIVVAERKRLGFPDSQLGSGFALRRLLLESIERLKAQPAASRYYTLLKLHFVDKQRVRELRGVVDLGDRSIYVEQNRAFKFLAQQLMQAEIEARIRNNTSETTASSASALAASNVPVVPESNAGNGVVNTGVPFLAPSPADFPLVGRDELVSTLRDALMNANGGVVVLQGLPGMGKTLLASAMTHDATVNKHFADGVLWAALGPSPDIAAIFDTWATALNLDAAAVTSQSDAAQRQQLLRAKIGTRRILIVLDDAANYDHINQLKVGGPNCVYLVTTRFGHVASEFHQVVTVGDLDEAEARQLLATSLGATLPLEICDKALAATGGMPLAIRLAGRWLKQAHGNYARAEQLIESIVDAGRFGQMQMPRLAPNAHPSLPADVPLSLGSMFDADLSRLSEAAQATLVALAYLPPLPQTMDLSWIMAVAASDTVLDAVLSSGLVATLTPDAHTASRFGLHPTLARYLQAVTSTRVRKPLIEACIDRMFVQAEESVRRMSIDNSTFKLNIPQVLGAARLLQSRNCWNSLAVLAEMACQIALRLRLTPIARELAQMLQQAATANGNQSQAQQAQTWLHLAGHTNGLVSAQAKPVAVA